MTGTPICLPETPNYTPAGEERMDTLSDVLRAVRLSGAVLFVGEFSAPWSVWAPDSRMFAPMLIPGAKQLVLFHLIAEGRCWAELESESPVGLDAGDVVVLPYGDAHAMCNPAGGTRTPMATLLPPPPWSEPPALVHGGGGEVTRILCGFLYCDDALFNPLFTMLPRVLRVRAKDGPSGSWLEANLRYMIQEVSSQRPGSASLIARLAELLFVDVLRRSIEGLGEDQIGWLAALKDPMVGKALQLLHADPTHAWSVEELGRRIGLSRSGLAERFRHLMGEPLMHYLIRWRLQLAAQLLRETDDGIAAIASRVGYDSEAAFSRAFKRQAGEPPAVWRTGARAARGSRTTR
jgi:AraC-like DNA-binding protein